MQNQDFGSTQYLKVEKEPENGVKVILAAVYEALTEKGYNPVDQIVGYITVSYTHLDVYKRQGLWQSIQYAQEGSAG